MMPTGISSFLLSANICVQHGEIDSGGFCSRSFDIEGCVTGFGHPDWEKTHEAAARTSTVVSMLVEGGATCVGKTVVDEMAFGYEPFQSFDCDHLDMSC